MSTEADTRSNRIPLPDYLYDRAIALGWDMSYYKRVEKPSKK